MNERAVTFGTGNGLVGVVTQPATPAPGAPGVLLLNAGLLHRVGPNRLNVEVARALAEWGVTSLRFDMAGIGDSEVTSRDVLDIERSRQDVVEAMDAFAETQAVDQFVLVGLCTGAYNAFRAALVDDRVVGAVLIDGYAYPTFRSRVRHYRTRVFQLQRWVDYARRRLGRESDDGAGDLVVFENEHVSRERFAAELSELVDRGVRLFMVYTEMGPLAFNYESQLADALPEVDVRGGTDVVYYEGTDHTFTLPGNRQQFMDDLATWMGSRFALQHSGSPR